MDLIHRIICWIIGDRWKFYQLELESDGWFRHHFQCERCGWFTYTSSSKADKIRQPRPFHIFRRFRALLGRIGIRYHSQNLNEKPGGIKGPMWKYGRGWLWIGFVSFGLEWSFFGQSSTGIDMDLGGEEEFKFSIRLYRVFALFFHISQILPRKWTREWKWWDWSWGREFGVKFHDGSIWISIFRDESGWSNTDAWWRHIVIHLDDILFGKQSYTDKTLETGLIQIAFPEKVYDVSYRKSLSTWKRKRWFTKHLVRYDLDMGDNPIPVPGKGENSWDIDDDAIYSSMVSATSLPAALAKLTESVYRSRLRYGSKDWKPSVEVAK